MCYFCCVLQVAHVDDGKDVHLAVLIQLNKTHVACLGSNDRGSLSELGSSVKAKRIVEMVLSRVADDLEAGVCLPSIPNQGPVFTHQHELRLIRGTRVLV